MNVATGNDSTGDGSSNAPFRSISKALSVVSSDSSINVATGTYSAATGETFPMSMVNAVDLIGASYSNTVIDGTVGGTPVIQCVNCPNGSISGFTVRGSQGGDNGAGIQLTQSSLSLINLRVTQNRARFQAGGINCGSGSSPLIRNCIVDHNLYESTFSSSAGGGIAVAGGSPTIENCTIVANNSDAWGVLVSSGNPTIRNCIVDNSGRDLSGVTTSMISFCDILGGAFNGTNHCVALDPQFISAVNSNYHMILQSPCLNIGTNLPWMNTGLDIDGMPRIDNVQKVVDVGAYEAKIPPKGVIFFMF